MGRLVGDVRKATGSQISGQSRRPASRVQGLLEVSSQQGVFPGRRRSMVSLEVSAGSSSIAPKRSCEDFG